MFTSYYSKPQFYYPYVILLFTLYGLVQISIWIFKLSILLRLLLLIIYVISIMSLWGYGYLRLNDSTLLSNPKLLKLRLVATSVSQPDKYDQSKQLTIFNNILKEAFTPNYDIKPPDYIILPEVVFNFSFANNPYLWEQLVKQIPKNSKLLMGVLREDKKNVYNSVYMIDGKTKQIVSYYDKIKLVPFGEYIPFSSYLPFISSFVGLSNLQRGEKQTIFIGEKEKFAIIICFEAIFSNGMLSYKNIDWLLNITNEAWFNHSIELDQINSLLRLRSIEGGVTTVKVANLGKSVIINPLGNYKYISEGYSNKHNNFIVDIQRGTTYYNFTYKNLLVSIIIMLYVMLIVIITWVYKRNR